MDTRDDEHQRSRRPVGLICLIATGLCAAALAGTTDDLVFIHHSCGANWLSSGLHSALVAKDYIDERNDICYGTDMPPDAGRPDSLGLPGDNTNMNHWVLWFNDYLEQAKTYGCDTGVNRIILFKSCYPISNVTSDGTEPGSPFSSVQSIANYRAVYRHPGGPGNVYTHPSNGRSYRPIEEVFAANPDTLFIPVTAPPRHYAPSDGTNDQEAHRARVFNDWLKNVWLPGYNAAHPGLNNVAVFDWFDVLAYPDNQALHPNRLKAEYGGEGGDSHPNASGNRDSTAVFATDPGNFIDAAWDAFLHGPRVDGDVNGDGCVNVTDLLTVRNNLGRGGSQIAPSAADVSSDGIVNVADLLYVRNLLGTGWGCGGGL
jgi:hypothetical protein